VSERADSTKRFGDRATAYAAFRPSYPDEAVDAALAGLGDPSELVVADVGAGTGISARLFAARVAHVVAIEPNAGMRQAAADHPRVEWVEGTADDTGLPDQSVDVVVACQAFHWFASPFAMAEFRRIARRRAAMLQYERDERNEFTKAYGDVVRAYARDGTEGMRMQAIATFASFPRAVVTRSAFTSSQELDLDGIVGRASSSSYLPNAGPEAESLERELREVFERFERVERSGKVELAMVTFVLVADFL